MAATSSTKYKKINVTGPISIERVDKIADTDINERGPWIILIMGPTGAGKSTFIEALGLGDVERISSGQLEGFTQTVTNYRMKNVVVDDGHPIYVIDSPGFADTKISEMAIVSMLQKWRIDNGGKYIHQVLYLTPITQVRLPGSQRQVVRTFQAITGISTAKSITIATTMWDSIAGEGAKARAEGTYNQLERDIWKVFIKSGAKITKFHNTQESALAILDLVLQRGGGQWYNVDRAEGSNLRQSHFAENLYTDLQNRIESQRSEIANIQSDLTYADAEGDELLKSVLLPRLDEAQKLLEMFQGELQDFGAAPDPVVPDKLEGRPIARALHFVFDGCACCGKGVEANHEI